MAYCLSGDIGGTKTLLHIATAENALAPVLQKSYSSAAYTGLAEIIEDFLAEAGIRDIASACFALAGPVNGRKVKLTNLPWLVDGDELAARFAIKHVRLINDFEAVGHGIAVLQPADFLTLQAGKRQEQAVRMVVGAGTGLGVAWMTWNQNAYVVHPSEGGHMDFAPLDELQALLLHHLQQRLHGHISYERIVSGSGLIAIFEFLRDTGLASPSAQIIEAMGEGDAAAVISEFSLRDDEEIAHMAVHLFLSVYGAFVGNMALASLPRGGIYIAGGIAGKMLVQMQRGEFIRAFVAKGRYAELLGSLPVHLVLNPNVGLIGANLMATRF